MDYNDITPYDKDVEVDSKPKRFMGFDGVVVEQTKIPIFDEPKAQSYKTSDSTEGCQGAFMPQEDGSSVPVLLSCSKGPVKRGECDPTGRSSHEPGAKLDAGKVDYTLIPPEFLEQLARACEDERVRAGIALLPILPLAFKAKLYTKGAEKYSRDGWKSVPDGGERYIKAAYRHLMAHLKGEYIDEETGLPHLVCLSWNSDAVLFYKENNLN